MYMQYGSGEDFMHVVTPGRSPNSYEPDYAYDEDSDVDLEFPDGDRSKYEFDGCTPNPDIEALLDRAFSNMGLIRRGRWDYDPNNGAPEIGCSLESDSY
jgi:hypothetical protein